MNNNFNENIKTCSFLLHSEHGFDQAPLEEITKEKYEEMISNGLRATDSADFRIEEE